MLNFNTLFRKKKRDMQGTQWEGILDSVVLPEAFLGQIETNGSNWYRPVISGIVCVETDGRINDDHVGKNRIRKQKFSREPLKGLKKIYIPLNRIIDLKKQHRLNSKIDSYEIIEENIDTMLEDLDKIKNLLTDRRRRRLQNQLTGCWLIYGEQDGTRHYLMVYDGVDHSTSDDEIYLELRRMYSELYLNQLQQKVKIMPNKIIDI